MTPRLLAAALAPALIWGLAAAETDHGVIMPPEVPRHEVRVLDTASDLARDLAETVAFLESGQSYFRAFKRSSHSKIENEAMLRFLQSYDRERETAKREQTVLAQWVRERSELETTQEKLDSKKKAQ